jgi:hypothetical protein
MTKVEFEFAVGNIVTTAHGQIGEVSALMWDGYPQCSLRMVGGAVEWWSERNLTLRRGRPVEKSAETPQ